MALFKTTREKRLWIYALLAMIGIFSTLFLGVPLQATLGNQNLQAAVFLIGIALVATTILAYGLKTKPGKMDLTVWAGLLAVYLVLFLRLGLAERSHLIEYSVLAIFIHRALSERAGQESQSLRVAFYAFGLSFGIGIFDELLQLFTPNRVFDLEDILFNGLASAMAIGSVLILNWARKRIES